MEQSPQVVPNVSVRKTKQTVNIKQISAAINKNKFYYLLFVPTLIYFIIFKYLPMMGIGTSTPETQYWFGTIQPLRLKAT